MLRDSFTYCGDVQSLSLKISAFIKNILSLLFLCNKQVSKFANIEQYRRKSILTIAYFIFHQTLDIYMYIPKHQYPSVIC